MTIIADRQVSRTKSHYRVADRWMDLTYTREDSPDVVRRYDVHIISSEKEKEMRGVSEYKFIVRDWPTLTKDIKSGQFEVDLEYVDGAIIEYDPIAIVRDSPRRMSDETPIQHIARCRAHYRESEAALLRLAMLSSRAWLITSSGPRDTPAILKAIESNPRLVITKTGVRGDNQSAVAAILRALPGVNPDIVLDDEGTTLYDVIRPTVDIDALIEALGIAKWPDLDYRSSRSAMSLARVASISEALRSERIGT